MPERGRQKRGFLMSHQAPRWLRGPAKIQGDWITLERSRAEFYAPLETPPAGRAQSLVFALAGVKTRRDIAAFVSKFGLLRHGPEDSALRESVAEFESEASTLQEVLWLANAVRAAVGGDDEQAEIIRQHAGMLREFFREPAPSDEGLFMQASKVIAWIVSDRLQETTMRMDAACELVLPDNRPGVFLLNVHPPNLLGWVYYQVAHMLVERGPLTTCQECGRVFAPHDKRQRYCEPKCANRARFAIYKERHPGSKVKVRPDAKATRTRRGQHPAAD
jgi:hypothetical protein